jgi:1-acyl-sn-glycerol-3-phosphate acyltransferase
MIPARRSTWFTYWFCRVARSRLEKGFGLLAVKGLQNLRNAVNEGPVMVVSNHTSWYDPLVVLWLTNVVVPSRSYAMMNAKNLRRLGFFSRVGAYGVDLDSEADGAAALRYSVKLLKEPGNVVWIFPQGDERPSFEPLHFRGGAEHIARLARVPTVPIGLEYVVGGNAEPELYVSIGEAVKPDALGGRARLERVESAAVPQAAPNVLMDAVAKEIVATRKWLQDARNVNLVDYAPFEVLHKRGQGRMDWLGERMLAAMFPA